MTSFSSLTTEAYLKTLGSSCNLEISDLVSQVVNDPVTRQHAVNHVVSAAARMNEVRAKLKKIVIKQSLPMSVQNDITSFFPFSIEFQNLDAKPHAKARAYRSLSRWYLYDMIGIKFSSAAIQVKDVGANFFANVKLNSTYVHSCCPVITDSDSVRHAECDRRLQQLHHATPEQRLMMKSYSAFYTDYKPRRHYCAAFARLRRRCAQPYIFAFHL